MDASLFGQYLLDVYNGVHEDFRVKTRARQIERYRYGTLHPHESFTAYRILADPENNESRIINMLVEDLRR